MKPIYPDLGSPPRGWTYGPLGTAVRLVPPGAYLDYSRVAIVVSPLVPRSRQLPEPAVLIQQALAVETARTGSEILEQADPRPITATTGLQGTRLEVRLKRGTDGKVERRVYVMYLDETWLYGLSYLADDESFPAYAALFDEVAASVQPYPAA